jgi:hypothetical protein
MTGTEHKFEHQKSLSSCTVCGAAEGQLLKWCPGVKLTEEAKEACYRGNVADLDYYRSRRDYEERQRAKR